MKLPSIQPVSEHPPGTPKQIALLTLKVRPELPDTSRSVEYDMNDNSDHSSGKQLEECLS